MQAVEDKIKAQTAPVREHVAASRGRSVTTSSVGQTKVDYEALQSVSQTFKQQAEAMRRTEMSLKRKAAGIRSTWIGKGGANQFQKEFEASIVPTYEKLVGALNEAGKVTTDIAKMFQDAEQEAKQTIGIVVN